MSNNNNNKKSDFTLFDFPPYNFSFYNKNSLKAINSSQFIVFLFILFVLI